MTEGVKVLIVEDEAIVQLHLQQIVGDMGLRVSATAASAPEALAEAERESPQLALVDINLGGRQDGIEVARALRAEHDCDVIFATAYADEATVARTADLGAAGYIVKPFTGAGVRAAISTALSARSREPAAALALAPPLPRPGPPVSRRFGAGTRMLFYSHDTFGLGHLQRSSNLIRTLLRRHPDMSALLVTGSPVVHRYALPKGADYVKLPAVFKVASEEYESRSLRISSSGILALRKNLLLRAVRDYDPEVLLVDHAPLGMKGELRPALEWLARRGSCRTILGLRDVTDAAEAVRADWQEKKIYDAMRTLYDDIVVYGSPAVYDLVREYDLPDDVAKKTRYLGYVCEPEPDEVDEESPPAPAGAPLVAVSIGGGDGAESLIELFLEMIEAEPGAAGFHTQILTGPLLAAPRVEAFRQRAEGLPVEVFDFMPSTSRWFERADLVVSTGGYNTSTQLLARARRAIVVPRVLHRNEQLTRARRLEELGLLRCLDPRGLTAELLRSAIREALARGNEPLAEGRAAGRVALDGAERLADFCSGLDLARGREEGRDG